MSNSGRSIILEYLYEFESKSVKGIQFCHAGYRASDLDIKHHQTTASAFKDVFHAARSI